MAWEFHFRSSFAGATEVGVYHAGCGGAPWQDTRPNCWVGKIDGNPGGGQNSVYVPSPWVVDFGAWLQVMKDGLNEVKNIAVALASEGDDLDADYDVLAGAFAISRDEVKAQVELQRLQSPELLRDVMNPNLDAAAKAVGKTAEDIKNIAKGMGFDNEGGDPNSAWGFVSDKTYQNLIHDNNDQFNGGWGWSVFTNPGSRGPLWGANHAFINQGHLIYWVDVSDLPLMKDPQPPGLWLPKR